MWHTECDCGFPFDDVWARKEFVEYLIVHEISYTSLLTNFPVIFKDINHHQMADMVLKTIIVDLESGNLQISFG